MDVDRVLNAARGLASQPLYQLSTAGQELFHSNMLYWLASAHPMESEPVFQALGLPSMQNGQLSASYVRREEKNIDLLVDPGFGAMKLVLENKLTSLATPGQLVRYSSAFGDRDDHVFTLLTLVPTPQVPEPWRQVTYRELLEPLESTRDALAGWDSQLVGAYRELVKGLVELGAAAIPAEGEDTWYLSPDKREEMRAERVLPLVEKMRAAYLAEQVVARTGVTAIEIGLTNTFGLVSYYGPARQKGHEVGWQLQGEQFRLAYITKADRSLVGKSKAARRIEFVEKNAEDWFDFDALGAAVLMTPNTRKPWLGYNPDFVYRYMKISANASWDEVMELCVRATRRVNEYQGAV